MIKLEKYTGEKTYVSPIGELYDKDTVLDKYPAALAVACVVGTDDAGETFLSFDPLNKLRSIYNIDGALGEAEAIAALETIFNTPPPEPEPSAEERIAAAMEYQNLINS